MPLKMQSVWLIAPRGYIQKLGHNNIFTINLTITGEKRKHTYFTIIFMK